jgi:uncharacterized protein
MDNPIQVDLGRIAQDLQIRRVQVESVVQLLDEGNTVPFITRYRKERTGNLNEVTIREIQLRVQRLRELADRKETILKAIEAQGKLSPDLAAAIRAADNPKRLEDLYLPFKPKKRTKASDARERGLEPLAFRIWTRDETLTDLDTAAQEFVNAEKSVETVEKVLEGVGHILAEAISEMAMVRDAVRKIVWKTGKIVTAKAEIPEGQGLEYRDYFDYSEPVAQIPPHRVLAINRGDKEGPLKVKLEVSRPDVEAVLFSQLPLDGHPQAELFRAAAMDAVDRLILPSMEREVRRDLTEAAEKHAVEVFARNLGSLLLQPPISKQVVLAIDPGFRTGCKVAVLDPSGNLLDQTVIFPHPPQNRRSEAKVALKDLVGKHKVNVVAIGNGTACRETEELIAEIIAEGTRFSQGEGAATDAASASPADAATPPPAVEDAGDSGTAPATTDAQAFSADQTGTPAEPAIDLPGEPAPAEGNDQTSPDSDESARTPSEELAPVNQMPAEDDPLGNGSGGDSHSRAETHASSPAEETVEMLPPISGGALDSDPPSPETEGGAAPAPESPPAPEAVSTAVLEGAGTGFGDEEAARSQEGSVPDDPAPTGDHLPVPSPDPPGPTADGPIEGLDATAVSEAIELESVSPAAMGEPIAGSAADLDVMSAEPAATGDHLPVPSEESTPSAPTAEPSPASAASDTTPAVPAAAPGGRPPRPGRSGGQGKPESSRRPPRSKQPSTPPPPQSPPQPHPADALLAQLAYVIVNEAGASVYSTSQVGRDELPDFDPTLRSSISIGRRLQDPLSELVKIEPQNIGVGLYQHDVNPKQLKETLDSVISSCVNFVGVDLNTASVPLLRHVSGLNQLTARRIVDFRKDHGPYLRRAQLTEVEGIGPATFTQAAGFLKLLDSEDPLDRTWVHPESYPAASKLVEKFGFTPDVVRDKVRLPELRTQLAQADLPALVAELEIGEFTLRDIIEALGRPDRDPRDDLPKPIFKKGVLKLEDLTAGMELKGTVLNVVDFGAFVDIGLKDSGLVHISQLANRYVKSPHDVVSVSDVVTVWVMGVDQERKRVSLTMVKPGTERHRGAPSGGRRGGGPGGEPRDPNREREGRGGPPGQGRRGGPVSGRSPRPTGSALTSPPVGAPSVAVLADTPSRRPDRDPGRDRGPGGGPRAGEASGAAPAPQRFSRGPGSGSGGGPPGSRGPHHGPGGGRSPRSSDRDQDRGAPQRPPSRPSRPSAPPPPLSKDALAGNIPLRTFGQLKQLWQARIEGPADSPEAPPPAADDRPSTAQDQPPNQTEPPDSTNAPVHQAEPETPSNPT